MFKVNRQILDNGLRLVHYEDTSTQMVALNIVYDVGARDEHPQHTGFAHLFEHLMFGGSLHIPDYDTPLQLAGGENNAWTNNDITNYYLTVPRQNVETGFWLESDRMLGLDFSERSLEVQRGVVMEEFKQRCLNQPYGDVGHLLRPLAIASTPISGLPSARTFRTSSRPRSTRCANSSTATMPPTMPSWLWPATSRGRKPSA